MQHTSRREASVVLLMLTVVCGVAASPDVRYQTIALSGQPAPGQGASIVFDRFASPRINTTGDTLFWAALAGPLPTSPIRGSLWSDRAGLLELLAVDGQPSPIIGNADAISGLMDPTFLAVGNIAYTGSFSPGGGNTVPAKAAIFTQPGAAILSSGAADTLAAPGLATPAPFANITLTRFNQSGTLALTANNGAAVWVGLPGGLLPIARAGDAAPGAAGFTFTHLRQPVLSDDGAVAFRASVDDVPGDSVIGLALYNVPASGGPQLVARAGTAAPGTEELFVDLAVEPALSDDGDVALWGSVTSEASPLEGIWADRSGTHGAAVSLLVLEGHAPPDVAEGQFSSFSRRPAMNSAGDLALHAAIIGPQGSGIDATNNAGIWLYPQGGSPVLVAREGDQAPGLAAGAVFRSLLEPSLNDRGQVAFLARVTGANIVLANNLVLVATDTCGGRHLIAQTGTPFAFPGDPGPARTITNIVFDTQAVGPGDGQFSSAGELIYTLEFANTATTFTHGVVTAVPHAPEDFNADGAIGSADITAFLTAWFAGLAGGPPTADFDDSGTVATADITAFLSAWFAGLGCGQ
ncbi:MAG: hypothetical protein H7Y88_05815 [Phycisphaerales bacterium]|nr:hypothetical protein [Phycisphaerales bacterium]